MAMPTCRRPDGEELPSVLAEVKNRSHTKALAMIEALIEFPPEVSAAWKECIATLLHMSRQEGCAQPHAREQGAPLILKSQRQGQPPRAQWGFCAIRPTTQSKRPASKSGNGRARETRWPGMKAGLPQSSTFVDHSAHLCNLRRASALGQYPGSVVSRRSQDSPSRSLWEQTQPVASSLALS